MTPERYQQVGKLFHAVQELAPEQRSVTSELAAMENSGSRTTICPRLSRFCRFPFAVRINTEINTVFLVQRHFWHSTWWTYWSPRGSPPMNSIRFFLYDSKHWRKSDHCAGIVYPDS